MTRAKSLVTTSPERAWGATVFTGTRVPVETLFGYLAAGDTLDEFLRQFPTVTRQQAVAVLEEAKVRVAELAAGQRHSAIASVLAAEPMPVPPEPAELRRELDASHARAG